MKVSRISRILKKHSARLDAEFRVKAIYLFGSGARQELSRHSDLDLIVEFYEPIGLFEFVALKDFLETILKKPVDLVSRDALQAWMIADIERDSIRVA